MDFAKIITYIIAAFSFKLNLKTDRDQIELEVKNGFFSRFFCIIESDSSCDAFGERIKSNMIHLLENGCSSCSFQMQAIGSIAIPYLEDEFPDLWNLLKAKYYKKQEHSIDSYVSNVLECLLHDLNCNPSLDLLRECLPALLKLKFIPGREDVTILFSQQLRILEKKSPFLYQLFLDKFNV